jgi:hypothetical protein
VPELIKASGMSENNFFFFSFFKVVTYEFLNIATVLFFGFSTFYFLKGGRAFISITFTWWLCIFTNVKYSATFLFS